MVKPIRIFCLFTLHLSLWLSAFAVSGQGSQTGKNDKEFNGTLGIMFGSSSLNTDKFGQWMADHTNGGLSTNTFFNYGLEGFAVKNHFVYGLAWRHESLFATSSPVSPRRGSIALHLGVSPLNPYNLQQLLITVGIGYCSMSVRFHGFPPASLRTYSIPDSKALMAQDAFWINPKVNLFHLIKFQGGKKIRVGLDAGVAFYFPGPMRYGYYYTYSTYGYNSRGQYVKQQHRKFIGHRVDDVPSVMPMSFNLSGYIGF
ncbi:MAG: hypothetical protein ACJ75J_07945 [Cytophagaceae bacterium]